MSEGIPQIGDDGSNGAQPTPITPERIAQARNIQEQAQKAAQAAAQAAVEEAEGDEVEQAPQPIFVSELDRVKAENLHLRLLLAAYKVKDAQQEMDKFRKEQQEAQQKIIQLQADLQERYSINLTTHEIRGTDGLVIPRGQGVDFGQMLQRIAMGPVHGQ